MLFQGLQNSVNVGKLLNMLCRDLQSCFINESLGYIKTSLSEEVVTHGLVQQHSLGPTELFRGGGGIVWLEVLRKGKSKAELVCARSETLEWRGLLVKEYCAYKRTVTREGAVK